MASSPGMNGRNGWMSLTRAGDEASQSVDAFERVRAAKAFPKTLLHPSIADQVWSALMRGDLDEAVFKAFKAVEVGVRRLADMRLPISASLLCARHFTWTLARLTRLSDPPAERQALSDLFAGAIGSYKNPHSHRTVSLTDPREVREQLMLATHLLRII